MIFLFRPLASLLIACPLSCSAQVVFDVPDDFADFYKNFRSAVISADPSALADQVCFPFQAHEVGAQVDRIYKIRRGKFTQLQLGKQLLLYPVGKDGPVVNGKSTPMITLYETQAEFIRETPDIRSASRLDAQAFKSAVSTNGNAGHIFNLEFSRKNTQWCWSGSTFDWDIPGLNVKP